MTFGVADPVGAIGIQADLAAFAAMGCHGLSVITGILLGDTARVEDCEVMDADLVADQARILLEDMQVSAFKIGAVSGVENISAIAEIVSDYPDVPLVLDPFISALPEQLPESEDMLVAMRELLIPQTTLLLLSAVELGRLAETWREAAGSDDLLQDALRIIESGCEYVFVTGTPSDAQSICNSLFNDTGQVRRDQWQRQSGSFTGAGGTTSAAIAALLANGLDVPEAVVEAQEFTIAALANAQRLGMGKLIPDRYFWARENDTPQ